MKDTRIIWESKIMTCKRYGLLKLQNSNCSQIHRNICLLFYTTVFAMAFYSTRYHKVQKLQCWIQTHRAIQINVPSLFQATCWDMGDLLTLKGLLLKWRLVPTNDLFLSKLLHKKQNSDLSTWKSVLNDRPEEKSEKNSNFK